MIENVEQEIWNDFRSFSVSEFSRKLSHSEMSAQFGLQYEDRGSLAHNATFKRLEHDEDYKIEQFLRDAGDNPDWDILAKLYPFREPIVVPSRPQSTIIPKFRSRVEHRGIADFLKQHWLDKKQSLRLKIPDEKAAVEYLIHIRWGDVPICPRCDSAKTYTLSTVKLFKCAKCRLQFSEKVGTIFKGSPLDLTTWYEAMYLLTSTKTAKISTQQLSEAIGVTQKTSWGMVQKIQSKVGDDFISKMKLGLFKQ